MSHLSVAERDGSCFVKRSLKCKGSFWLFSWESHALPLDHEHLTWRRWMWNTSQTRNQTIWGTRTCSNVIPSSKYCTVESLESLGSKSAIRGAMYCVAVSIRWVMSPVKMNPGKKKGPDGKKYVRPEYDLLPSYKTTSRIWTCAGKVTRTSVIKSKRTPCCYGNLPQVMSVKRKVKRQGNPLQREYIETHRERIRHFNTYLYVIFK